MCNHLSSASAQHIHRLLHQKLKFTQILQFLEKSHEQWTRWQSLPFAHFVYSVSHKPAKRKKLRIQNWSYNNDYCLFFRYTQIIYSAKMSILHVDPESRPNHCLCKVWGRCVRIQTKVLCKVWASYHSSPPPQLPLSIKTLLPGGLAPVRQLTS